MNSSMFWMGILPLVVFVIVDSFAGVQAGMIAAIILAVAEAIFTYFYFGEIDSVTWLSLALVLALAAVTYFTNNTMFIKLQPVALGAVVGLVLLVSYMIGKPLLLTMSQKYQSFFPPQVQMILEQPKVQRQLQLLTLTSGIMTLAHAGLTAYAAMKMSNWWWLGIRGIGYYIFLFAAVVLARFIA